MLKGARSLLQQRQVVKGLQHILETTVRRINEWTRPLVEGEVKDGQSFEMPEYLVGVVGKNRLGQDFQPLPAGWRRVTDNRFSHMVLARYPAASPTQLISQDWIDRAFSRWKLYTQINGELPPDGTQGILGVDVGEYGSDPSVLCMRYGGWVHPFQQWSHTDVLTTGDYVADAFITYNGWRVCVDATGVGSGVAPQIMRSLRAKRVSYKRGDIVGVKVAERPTESSESGDFAQLRDQLWWAVREWLKDDSGAMLPPDEELRDELLAPLYAFDGKGRIKVSDKETLRSQLGRSTNKADALALTFAPKGLPFQYAILLP